MISFQEYVSADAVAWAQRIRQGEVTATEVVDAAIGRAEAVNPRINAIAVKLYEQARDRASKPLGSGPVSGSP